MLYPLAASVAILGGFATWLSLSTGLFLIWAAFIAWGCFFQSGGNAKAFRATVVCTCFGVFVAWVVALIIVAIPGDRLFSAPVWAGLVVGASIVAIIVAAHLPALATIPAVFYGYAATFAYMMHTAGAMETKALLAATGRNPLFLVALSMIVGATFGIASASFSDFLARVGMKSDRAASPAA